MNDGIRHALNVRGKMKLQHFDKDGVLKGEYNFPNGITTPGMNALLDLKFNGGSPISTWYIGLIDNASFSAVNAADTMASHAGWIECTAYDESTRPTWTSGAASARSVTNASTVDFTMNATKTIHGLFVTSGSAKSGTSGELWSTAILVSDVIVNSSDVLRATYSVDG